MDMAMDIVRVALIGAGATAFMDAVLVLQRRMGMKTADFALVGRWVGNMARGEFAHAAIARARPVTGERALGWTTHYAVGIGFAAVLVAIAGHDWVAVPTLAPAFALGIASVAAPLFVMQPAMGAGFAGAKTASPLQSCLRSLLNHTIFGVGLYVSAVTIGAILRLF